MGTVDCWTAGLARLLECGVRSDVLTQGRSTAIWMSTTWSNSRRLG